MKRIRSAPVDEFRSTPAYLGDHEDPRDHHGVSRVRGGPPPARRIAFALGRIEARKLALSPLFLLGILVCLTSLAIFPALVVELTDGFPEELSTLNARILQDMPYTAHPFGALALLAANRNATRARRDRMEELLDACPTAPATRAAGALWSAWLPVVVLAAFVPAYVWLADAKAMTRPDLGPLGPLGPGLVPNVLTTLVVGAGGVPLGIALGRWVRIPLASVATMTLIGFGSTWLSAGDPGMLETRMLLSTLGPTGSGHEQPLLTAGQAWFHFAWLSAFK